LKRLGRVVLVMLLVLAVASPALAAQVGKAGPQGRPFTDVVGTWAEWSIAKMHGLGIVNGVGNGEFDPEGELTRAQIAVMFCRALGMEEDAVGMGPLMSRAFGDEDDVPTWAKAHVRVCFQARLLLGEIRGNMRVFNPNKPITRQEFVVLLVRAADAEAEAAELVDDEGEADVVRAELMEMFKDGKHIGAWALGSIAYAMQEEWIGCLLGRNTFQPNKPVTRAEACCMLEAAGAEMDFNWTNRYVGVITDLDLGDGEITIDPGARTFMIADGCLVRIDREPAELDDLMVGYAVKLYANETGVICIEASTEVEDEDGEDDEDDVEELIGVITNVNVAEMQISFDVDEAPGETDLGAEDYDVDETVTVKDGAQTLDFDEDLEGEHVEIKLVNGVVTRISIED